MIKNTGGQSIGAQMITATDGSAFTGAVTVYVTGDGGTQAAGSVGSGACTHEGNGYHTYAPAQAETNYALVAFTFTGSGAIPATVQVETAGGDSYAVLTHADYGLAKLARTGADSDTLETLSDQLDARALETTAQSILTDTGTTLDTLIKDIPTVAELEARTLPAADYVVVSDTIARVTLVDTTTNVTNLPSLDLSPVIDAIADLNDFDPLNDVVAHVSLVDVTTEVTIPQFIDLSGIPSAGDIADAVWDEAVAEHTAPDSTGAALAAAGDPWIAPLPGAYAEGSAGYLLGDLHERLEEQVEDGPAVVIPAPAAGQTTAWAMCYDEDGLPEKDVEIFIQCVSATGTAAVFDGATVTLKSDANGLAAGPIPRNASLKFTARRGDGGKRVRFTGADADSLALPALVGTP